MGASSDFVLLAQQRELRLQEQRAARAAYAYGVDIRRTQLLEDSGIGDPFMRAVDRGFPEVRSWLDTMVLDPVDRALPVRLLESVSRWVRWLRAPVPSVRALSAGALRADAWPLVTPIGTARGVTRWLLVDVDAVAALDEPQRAFVIGSALGHLQCDHGPMYLAHLARARTPWANAMVRFWWAPWSRVAVFSGDRAGLLCAGALEPALEALRVSATREPTWFPRQPALSLRIQALQEFDKTAVVRRTRAPVAAAAGTEAEGVTPPPKGVSETAGLGGDTWSLARCDTRLTAKLGIL